MNKEKFISVTLAEEGGRFSVAGLSALWDYAQQHGATDILLDMGLISHIKEYPDYVTFLTDCGLPLGLATTFFDIIEFNGGILVWEHM